MPLMAQDLNDSIPPTYFPHHHSHSIFSHYSIPGSFTIVEEPEELTISRSSSISHNQKSRTIEGDTIGIDQILTSRDHRAVKRLKHLSTLNEWTASKIRRH